MSIPARPGTSPNGFPPPESQPGTRPQQPGMLSRAATAVQKFFSPGEDRLVDAVTRRTPYSRVSSETGMSEGGGSNFTARIVNPVTPYFHRFYAEEMLDEPIIRAGLTALKSIVGQAKFKLEVDSGAPPEFGKYVSRQLTRFWNGYAPLALRKLEYGWAPFEVMYRLRAGQVNFHSLIYRDPSTSRPVFRGGELIGVEMEVQGGTTEKPIYLPLMKSFWAVHQNDMDPVWGRSHLNGPHIPWFDYRGSQGYTDSRALWARKSAISPAIIIYPDGGTYDKVTGQIVSNRDTASLIAQMLRNDSVIAVARGKDEASQWDVKTPQAMPAPEGLMQIGQKLEDEILLALGVMPEVVRPDGTGAYNGRMIPMMVMLGHCQSIASALVEEFDEQILSRLVTFVWGKEHPEYEITVQSMQDLMTNTSPSHHRQGGELPPEGEENGEQQPSMPAGV